MQECLGSIVSQSVALSDFLKLCSFFVIGDISIPYVCQANDVCPLSRGFVHMHGQVCAHMCMHAEARWCPLQSLSTLVF